MLTGCALPSQDQGGPAAEDRAPERFTIVPDDYHVPYAGTAEDGRRFFLSEELFSYRPGHHAATSYVGLFLWNADGSFDEVRVDAVDRPKGLPAGQAGPAGAEYLVKARLAELGDYVLEPGDFIAYYAPWDGLEYDT